MYVLFKCTYCTFSERVSDSPEEKCAESKTEEKDRDANRGSA
jgi:hypothetical protein